MNEETINEGEMTIKDRVSPRRIGNREHRSHHSLPELEFKNRICSPRAVYIYIYTHISLRARGDLSPGLDFIGRNGQKFGDRYHRSDSWYPGVGNGQAVRDAREKGEE